MFGDSEPMPGRYRKERGMAAAWSKAKRSHRSAVISVIAKQRADARSLADTPVENPNASELRVGDRVCSPVYWGEGVVRTILPL